MTGLLASCEDKNAESRPQQNRSNYRVRSDQGRAEEVNERLIKRKVEGGLFDEE